VKASVIQGSGLGPASFIFKAADLHLTTPTTQFFTGRMPFLPPNQQHQSTEDSLFKTILKNSYHVLYPYLPENHYQLSS